MRVSGAAASVSGWFADCVTDVAHDVDQRPHANFLRKRPMKTSTSFVSYSCACSQTRSHNSVRVKTRPGSRKLMTKMRFAEVFPDNQIVATMSHPLNKTLPTVRCSIMLEAR